MEKWVNPAKIMSLSIIDPGGISGLPQGNNLFQSQFWAQMKGDFGWKSLFFNIDGKLLLVLVKTIIGKYSIAYIPHGPESQNKKYSGKDLRRIGINLRKYLPKGCFLLRYDLPDGTFQTEPGFFDFSPELKKSHSDIQPPDTVILSLNKSEDEILKGMKSKTRYNIRLAVKKGIVVTKTGIEGLDIWYDLYQETSLRDKIAIHSKNYYRKIFELSSDKHNLDKNPEIILFNAEYNNEVLAGIIVSIYGDRATYLYGASSGRHRNLMPAYALQWEAIKYAKQKGCSEYDFFGIPPNDNPDHPMSGLYRFKTGFGGEILHRPGCWDLPLKPFVYSVYRWAEAVRLFYYKKIRKR